VSFISHSNEARGRGRLYGQSSARLACKHSTSWSDEAAFEATRQPRGRRPALRQAGVVPGHHAVECSRAVRVDAVRRTMNTHLDAT
jgi:hypothetical protein